MANQQTRIPNVPLRTPMFDEHGNLTRTWIIFFERLGMSEAGEPGPADVQSVVFGIATPIVIEDVGWYPEIALPAGQVWIPISARITAYTAPTGASIKVDCYYSIDAGNTWRRLFGADSSGNQAYLELPAGLHQNPSPFVSFAGGGAPRDLRIPARALMRCAMKQVGATASGANVIVEVVGEIGIGA